MREAQCMILAALLCGAAFGQAPAGTRPIFEIADVHASPKTLHPSMQSGVLRPGVYQLRNATMVDLVATAYGIEPDKVMGGPNWLEMDRFDVIAKVPPTTPPQGIKLMLQSLLAERFNLAVHMDQRPMPAFVLSRENGKPKLKQSDGSGQTGCQRQPQSAEAGAIPASCHGVSMDAFVQQLRAAAGDYLMSPVINDTKLEGAWDFNLKWTPRAGLAAAGADGITIFDAIDNQLGLKLEAKQAPTPVIVVDRVNQKPTANPSGVTTSLPPEPPPSFEVATIKPTDPKFQGVRIQTPPGGLNVQGLTLSYLIQTIWFITPDMIVGAPKWLDTDRWDITAKVAAAPGSAPPADMDSLIVMVRTLLEDRFKLKTHMEERVVPAYTLTVSKPKLQPADSTSRSGCKEGPGADGKDPRIANPMLSRLVACRNMTMAQFAVFLPNIANALNPLNGPIRSSVLDSTGLNGAYDFTLNFSPSLYQTSPGGGGSNSADPDGALSISDAISKQLGLKLELDKRTAPVLVIDHIEPKPTDN
jgi:uncharacterized protein (TIGR03435 family)